jgi:hypothetical protein
MNVRRAAKMDASNQHTQVTISPEEDARLPILEARIEREWKQWRRPYYKSLKREGGLREQVHQTAIWCIEILNQFQNRA